MRKWRTVLKVLVAVNLAGVSVNAMAIVGMLIVLSIEENKNE